jgi:hypothetical protein
VQDFSLVQEYGLQATRETWGLFLLKTKNLPVYVLRRVDTANEHTIRAYWLSYLRDAQSTVAIESGADVMFTPLIVGCSFAWQDYSDGIYKARRANLQTRKGKLDSTTLNTLFANTPHKIHKKNYNPRRPIRPATQRSWRRRSASAPAVGARAPDNSTIRSSSTRSAPTISSGCSNATTRCKLADDAHAQQRAALEKKSFV